MNWYRIAQSNDIYYRGSPSLETKPTIRDFPGVYFVKEAHLATMWGNNVAAYKIPPKNFCKFKVPLNRFTMKFLDGFMDKYGFGPRNIPQQWKSMGAKTEGIAKLDSEDDYEMLLAQLLLFPNQDWVNYLKRYGYHGFFNEYDLFLFDPNEAQYLGQYDFEKNIISQIIFPV